MARKPANREEPLDDIEDEIVEPSSTIDDDDFEDTQELSFERNRRRDWSDLDDLNDGED
jgi:hypothetical protein